MRKILINPILSEDNSNAYIAEIKYNGKIYKLNID